MTIAEMIDKKLKLKKLSRRQAAIKAGIPPSSFQSAMQRDGSMSFDMLQRIADVLDVRVSDITGEYEAIPDQNDSDRLYIEEVRKNAGANIRKLREELELNQTEFANVIGISKTVLSGYENGQRTPDIDFINLIKKKTGCSSDYLLGLTSVMREDSCDLEGRFHLQSAEAEELIKVCGKPLFRYFLQYNALSRVLRLIEERAFEAAVDPFDSEILIQNCLQELRIPIYKMVEDTVEQLLEDPAAEELLAILRERHIESQEIRRKYLNKAAIAKQADPFESLRNRMNAEEG